jgi:hypothetical protein
VCNRRRTYPAPLGRAAWVRSPPTPTHKTWLLSAVGDWNESYSLIEGLRMTFSGTVECILCAPGQYASSEGCTTKTICHASFGWFACHCSRWKYWFKLLDTIHYNKHDAIECKIKIRTWPELPSIFTIEPLNSKRCLDSIHGPQD